MKIDKPFNHPVFRDSMFVFSPRMILVRNSFYVIPAEFLRYGNGKPTDRKPEVLV